MASNTVWSQNFQKLIPSFVSRQQGEGVGEREAKIEIGESKMEATKKTT